MISSYFLADFAALAVIFWTVRSYMSRKSYGMSHGPLPPGPKPKPIIGNLLDMPQEYMEKVFTQWRNTWGNVVYLNVIGQPIVILNSLKDAQYVFERLGSKSSGRPQGTMCAELMGWEDILFFNKYGEKWHEGRKYFHQYLGGRGQLSKVISRFSHIQERETRRALKLVLYDPAQLEEHIRRVTGAAILDMTYSYRVKPGKDEFVDLVEAALAGFNETAVSNDYMVDILPILKYVPSWMPGAGWKRKAKAWRALLDDTIRRPYARVKEELAKGTATESFVTLNQDDKTSEHHDWVLKTAAASMYAGGADTSVASVYSFFLAMTLYPEVQKKAQDEIDRVVGNDRLPSFEDMNNLPYVRGIVSEALRWLPVAPILTRSATEDFVLNGYHIPANSVILSNIWLFLHDPSVYTDPLEFKPERYLKTETHEPEQDPRVAAFGFGRRICPGMNVAEASIYIQCATYLSVFNITKAVVGGVEVTPVAETTPGAINHPKHFVCSIKPRSAKAQALILSEY